MDYEHNILGALSPTAPMERATPMLVSLGLLHWGAAVSAAGGIKYSFSREYLERQVLLRGTRNVALVKGDDRFISFFVIYRQDTGVPCWACACKCAPLGFVFRAISMAAFTN